MRYFETRARGKELIDVNIKIYLEGQKRVSIEDYVSFEVRGTIDTRSIKN